jgi:hypothetical protein
MNILVVILVIVVIVSTIGTVWYGITKARRFAASCQGTNPTISCYGSVYTPGKFMRLRPVTLQLNGQTLRITNTRSSQTTEVKLSDSTVSQGGKISWMRVVLQNGDTSWWLSPFSMLYLYMMQGGIIYTQKAFLPARNALTQALTAHGAKLSTDSVA